MSKHEEEVDLRDYINILVKRRLFILTVFLLSIIAAVAVSLSLPKVYEANAMVQNGLLAGQPVISNYDALGIIRSAGFLSSVLEKYDLKISLKDFLSMITAEGIANTNLVVIYVRAHTSSEAKKYCECIAKEYIAYGQTLYEQRGKVFKARLDDLSAELTDVEDKIRRLEKVSGEVASSKVAAGPEESYKVIFSYNAIATFLNQINYICEKKYDVELIFAAAKQFEIVSYPIASEAPVKPKKKKIVIFAAMLGAMMGLFAAFFTEYWKTNLKR